MKKTILLCVILLYRLSADGFAIGDSSLLETPITLETKTGKIFGTLTTPKEFNHIPVVLIVAGSGPTDRDGNSPFMKNNSLKQLAYGLGENNIASVRFDKRGIGESKDAMTSENDIRFEDYVNDTKDWIQLLKQDKRFSSVVIMGHSEGSLIGMIAAAGAPADQFISIAGAGQSADKILKEQLSTQPKEIQQEAFSIINKLKKGKTFGQVDQKFYSLFRPSVQPYLISWFRYDPQKEIKKLTIPILIIQGTKDIQVSADDAQRLVKANPKAELVLIENMNHIFKRVTGDKDANIKTYSAPALPIMAELVSSMVAFILKN